ncbi:MAG TPA: hypothetical protein VGP72_16390 [Planctomycetota bacterium]|jgi:hypothetical protein
MAKERIKYSPETKAKIVEAVIETRKTGSWKDAHAAARKIGYKGGLDSLIQFMKGVKKAAKKVASEKKAAPAKASSAPAVPTVAQEAAPMPPKPAAKKAKPKAQAKPAATVAAPKAPAKRYDAKTKAAIIDATIAARKGGRTWNDAFKAAQKAGYTGTRPGLEQMIRNAKLGKASQRPAVKSGRPAGKRRGRPPMQAKAPAGLESISQIVAQTVRQQVNAAIDMAIAALKQARI